MTVQASLDWLGGAPALRFASLDPKKALAANEALKPKLKIELRALGRMSLELETQAFPLPRGTRFLARFDKLGHFLVWPDQKRYRTIGSGSLRTLLSERRPDVAPLLRGELHQGPPGKRLGLVTRRHDLKSSRGAINLEQVFIEGSALGGPLLCRWIVELIGLRTTNDSCERNWIPVWASIREGDGGELIFAATELLKELEGYERVYVPPRNATFVKRGLPALKTPFLERDSMAALRDGQGEANLGANNNTPSGAFLLLNSVRIAFIPPHTESIVGPFIAGEYGFGYRDFFGKQLRPEVRVRVPVQLSVGASEDAGLPQP